MSPVALNRILTVGEGKIDSGHATSSVEEKMRKAKAKVRVVLHLCIL